MICLLRRRRWAVWVVLVLAFGLPVFLLPEKVEGDSRWAEWYNQTLGSSTYKEDIKPIVDKALGGTLRLFAEKVYNGYYFTRNEEVVLYANATLPNGSTLEQMNVWMKRMETYLSQFKEIRQFHTSVYSAAVPLSASISRRTTSTAVSPIRSRRTSSARPFNWAEAAGASTACRTRASAMMCARGPVLPGGDVWLQLR